LLQSTSFSHKGAALTALAARSLSGWRHVWLSATVFAAFALTVIDALLLQRKRGYFTGGFLSVDHVKSPLEGIAFVLASLGSDAAVLGLLTALTLWGAGRLAIGKRSAWALAVALALAPAIAANIITYELLDYLGDAFDFGLMFDLSGRSVAEIFAVSSAHLAGIAVGGVAAAVAFGAALWWLARRGAAEAMSPMPFLRTLALPVVLLALVLLGSAVVRTQSDVLDSGLRRKPSGRVLGIIADRLSDVDGDGFGVLGRVRDPNPLDSTINPYAPDVPGNGIDEDGVGGDLPTSEASYDEGNGDPPRWTSRRDVILIVLESFRGDVVGQQIDGRSATPALDALAAEGVASRHAFSHNGYTVQSRRHIFTGSVADIRGRTTLIDDFKANGYETAYFSGQDDSFGGPYASVGMERADVSFDARNAPEERYTMFATPGSLALPASSVTRRVSAFLQKRQRDRPLFMYVNFHDTHFPYHYAGIQPLVKASVLEQFEIGPQNAEALRSMYLNTAANVDRAIGDVLASARAALSAEPGVIVVSDHGESLYESGFLGHGYALDQAQTGIPFIAAHLPVVMEEPVGQADLRDMLADALDAPDPAAAPRLVAGSTRRVFQYLGGLDQPMQIAFTFLEGQLVYDFRSGRVLLDGKRWVRPADLTDKDAATFRSLIHLWEAMKLARERVKPPL
jgi:arylsulfatase A-like enzyme